MNRVYWLGIVSKIGLIYTGGLGWRSVVQRYINTLPSFNYDVVTCCIKDYPGSVKGMSRTRIPHWVLYDAIAGRQAYSAIRRLNVDTVYFITQSTALLASGLRRAVSYGDATWSQISSLNHYGLSPSWQLRLFERHGLGRLNRQKCVMFGMSKWYLDELRTTHRYPPARLHELPLMVDTDSWSALKVRDSSGKLRVVFVGGDFERKGGPLVREISRQLKDEAVFTYITKEALEAESNEKYVVDLQPDSSLLVQEVSNCDLLILPTKADCNSHVVVEAASLGLPSIVSHVGGVPELVEDGVTGRILRSFELADWVAAVREYAEDRRRVKDHGSAAQDRARRRHSVKAHMSILKSVLEAI